MAEDLPFPDNAFDASLASITIHQWSHLEAGLKEMRRVTKGPVVIFTFDPVALKNFWLRDFAPEMMANECGRMPSIDRVQSYLGGYSVVTPVPIPRDCTDGFAEAFFGRPEAFLDERVRRAQSAWGFSASAVVSTRCANQSRSLDFATEILNAGFAPGYGELVGMRPAISLPAFVTLMKRVSSQISPKNLPLK
jgi:SAM-dependent methyltransferase